jgi:hypothetical protein
LQQGQKELEMDAERAWTQREGCIEGAKRDVRDAIKLERIGVIEEQRWTKLERGRRYSSESDPEAA